MSDYDKKIRKSGAEVKRIAEWLKTPSADMRENLETIGALVENLIGFRNGLEERRKNTAPEYRQMVRFHVIDIDNQIAHYQKAYTRLKADIQRGKFDGEDDDERR